MFKLRKYIASILVFTLLCSILPAYTGVSDKPEVTQVDQVEKELVATDITIIHKMVYF
ncbi:hypothetical protein [Peribacillus muralis]|uniref:hypothetical protein n=1 Tax=Peribacillus muralis TaxID=264697 RepID=UPI003CFF045B